jgi:hypothetical protein
MEALWRDEENPQLALNPTGGTQSELGALLPDLGKPTSQQRWLQPMEPEEIPETWPRGSLIVLVKPKMMGESRLWRVVEGVLLDPLPAPDLPPGLEVICDRRASPVERIQATLAKAI